MPALSGALRQERTMTQASTPPPRLPQLDFERIGPRVGTRFPDVRLPNQHGQLVDLHAERAGRRALVLFYRSAAW